MVYGDYAVQSSRCHRSFRASKMKTPPEDVVLSAGGALMFARYHPDSPALQALHCSSDGGGHPGRLYLPF